MVQDKIDKEIALAIVFAWGSAVSLGLISDNLIPFIDAGRVLIEFGNASITIGRIASIGSLIAILVNRDASLSETNGTDVWIVWATIALNVAPPLFPAFAETLAQKPAAIIAFSVQTYGFILASMEN